MLITFFPHCLRRLCLLGIRSLYACFFLLLVLLLLQLVTTREGDTRLLADLVGHGVADPLVLLPKDHQTRTPAGAWQRNPRGACDLRCASWCQFRFQEETCLLLLLCASEIICIFPHFCLFL